MFIAVVALIWQAVGTNFAFLAYITFFFTKEPLRYIDLHIILINYNTQNFRYMSCGKHKWHVSTNWLCVIHDIMIRTPTLPASLRP